MQTTAENYFDSDAAFNKVYTGYIEKLSERHWTPVDIAQQASKFLANTGAKILDIGSGAGKFCLVGAHSAPNAHFIGIEQRRHLVEAASGAQKKLGIKNASFIHGNFTQLDLRQFDHFYFYNAFYENITPFGRIDNDIEHSDALFYYYVDYLYNELLKRPPGTKIVTYQSFHGEIPHGYEMVDSRYEGDLNFWMRK